MSERVRAMEVLRRHGTDATSFQLLERDYAYFFEGEGFVAYVDTGTAWVAGGRPVAPEGELVPLAQAFVEAAHRAGRRASFFAVDEAFVREARLRRVQIGAQPFWLPAEWREVLASSSSLRYQVKRARTKGVVVRRLTTTEIEPGQAARREIEALLSRWSLGRSLAPMGFLVRLEPFIEPGAHVYLVAEKDGRIVGFLSAVPIFATRGWLIEDLLRDRTAPNGTIEALVDHAMKLFADDASGPVTLGLAPLAGDVPPVLRGVRAAARWLFDFRGLYTFKRKLRPAFWEPLYVATPPASAPWVAVIDGLCAFADGSFFRFGLATFARAPRIPLGLLTLALLVWTPLLWAATTDLWFPSRNVQIAWIWFDASLALGLVALLHRYRAWLAVVLAIAVTADALLTTTEALAFNVHRAHTAGEALVVVIACLGPILGAVTLWLTVRRWRVLERLKAAP